jgi:hypothetical protein
MFLKANLTILESKRNTIIHYNDKATYRKIRRAIRSNPNKPVYINEYNGFFEFNSLDEEALFRSVSWDDECSPFRKFKERTPEKRVKVFESWKKRFNNTDSFGKLKALDSLIGGWV